MNNKISATVSHLQVNALFIIRSRDLISASFFLLLLFRSVQVYFQFKVVKKLWLMNVWFLSCNWHWIKNPSKKPEWRDFSLTEPIKKLFKWDEMMGYHATDVVVVVDKLPALIPYFPRQKTEKKIWKTLSLILIVLMHPNSIWILFALNVEKCKVLITLCLILPYSQWDYEKKALAHWKCAGAQEEEKKIYSKITSKTVLKMHKLSDISFL